MEKNKECTVSGKSGEKVIKQQFEACRSDAENNASAASSPALPPLSESGISGRVPFTSLSQVDSDMALARALQEQERAYFLLQIGHSGGGRNDTDTLFYEEYHFDVPVDDEEDPVGEGEEDDDDEGEEEILEEVDDALEQAGVDERATDDDQIDGTSFVSDEAFARALQDKEDRDTTARLMALSGIHDMNGELETASNESQEVVWESVDPDNMSYEELVALGEAVGTESKGLNPQLIAALEQFTFVSDSKDNVSDQEQCVVCRLDYEDGDKLLRLPCKHLYHTDCIEQWLECNKVCPVCSAEVTSESSTFESKS